MVIKNKIKKDDGNIIKTINEDENNIINEISLEDVEIQLEDKLKQLKQKNSDYETEVRSLKEELARAKADYLNARRHQEEDSKRDQARNTIKHIENLLPLYDSFYLAMLDKNSWEKTAEVWRKGVEGIYNQLLQILSNYNVSVFNTDGEIFDPNKHEALATVPVESSESHNKILTTIQVGFMQKVNDQEIIIRPARVTVGEYKTN